MTVTDDGRVGVMGIDRNGALSCIVMSFPVQREKNCVVGMAISLCVFPNIDAFGQRLREATMDSTHLSRATSAAMRYRQANLSKKIVGAPITPGNHFLPIIGHRRDRLAAILTGAPVWPRRASLPARGAFILVRILPVQDLQPRRG
ncbi:hypothetical protein [Burkholderia territorii]|uniref:hypothetical protein n=1 Tax=Burkholderia territorii TaxID=1503055 RepID=UPI0018C8D23F|nr:hypothetical protein [Burkholderia territorii]